MKECVCSKKNKNNSPLYMLCDGSAINLNGVEHVLIILGSHIEIILTEWDQEGNNIIITLLPPDDKPLKDYAAEIISAVNESRQKKIDVEFIANFDSEDYVFQYHSSIPGVNNIF